MAGGIEAMNGVQYLKLTGDARAFRQAAWLIEREIDRLEVKQGDLVPVGGSTGWPSHSVWESLKTASHFNLSISLELRLKCLLGLHGVAPVHGRSGHCLAGLYDRLGEGGDSARARLERLFAQAMTRRPFRLVAFLSTDAPEMPEPPGERTLETLRDVLAYMDEDAELWRKRYSWEKATAEQWRHYIDDLGAFFEFLDTTESLAMEMARRRGIVRRAS